ncbi:hypothetical protein ACT3TZ_13445 [Brachybacterium sp. AOP25-B2-12]|uniref:hypothetical protein n=1 Tax=Brachybacterium sp. AOP25-B2-12 TaxID=3457710 RepID=UPI00403438EE
MSFSLSTAILRAVPGAYILNSGLGKVKIPAAQAEFLRDAAAQGVPLLKELSPEQFGKFLAYGEIAVGSLLLAPFVPTRIAGLALSTLSAGFLAAYFRTDAFTKADGVRPSEAGTPVSKDLWLAAIGAALVIRG